MGKFNPAKVPKWCKWIAVDEDGGCWAYSAKPIIETELFGNRWMPKHQTGRWHLLYTRKPSKNWKDELYTWG